MTSILVFQTRSEAEACNDAIFAKMREAGEVGEKTVRYSDIGEVGGEYYLILIDKARKYLPELSQNYTILEGVLSSDEEGNIIIQRQ